MFPCSSRFGSCFVLMLVLAAVAAPATALHVTPATAEATDLTIGDSLVLSWDGLAANSLYRVVITDDIGREVSETPVKSDPDGGFRPALVWASTGVVGCDPGADPAPDAYRFSRLEEAEDALKNRVFELALVDEATQASVRRISLQLKVRGVNLIFFSDADGCPRCFFLPGEKAYVSGYRVVLNSFWMFLIDADEEPPAVGDPLDDPRGEPQEMQPPSSYFTEEIVGGLAPGTTHLGVVEKIKNGSEPPAVLTPTGIVLDPRWRDPKCSPFDYSKGVHRMRDNQGDKPTCGPGEPKP